MAQPTEADPGILIRVAGADGRRVSAAPERRTVMIGGVGQMSDRGRKVLIVPLDGEGETEL